MCPVAGRRMISYLKLVDRFLRGALSNSRRFVRLTPNQSGRIFFFDKHRREFLSLQSRGPIDSSTADQVYTQHQYNFGHLARSKDIQNKYESILLDGKEALIVDCGANIGLSARYFATEYHEARIIALEPDIENAAIAKTHCKKFKNVEIRQVAVGAESGFVAIVNPNADTNAFQTRRIDSVGGVGVVTINQLLEEFNNAELFIVKIDIEGFEADLFSAHTDWIKKAMILIIELHDWMIPNSANSHNFLRAISADSRDFVVFGENIFSIRND
jgi:FkbM family methyltransferase